MSIVSTITIITIAVISFLISAWSVIARWREIKKSDRITFINGKNHVTIPTRFNNIKKMHESIKKLVEL